MCNRFLKHLKAIDPRNNLTDLLIFDGASNVQLGGKLLKVHYPKLTVMLGVEHTVSLFFNDVSKIPIVNQMFSAHKMIYNIFGSGIYHKPHSIFKSKSQYFHKKKHWTIQWKRDQNGWIFRGDTQTPADAESSSSHYIVCKHQRREDRKSVVGVSTTPTT